MKKNAAGGCKFRFCCQDAGSNISLGTFHSNLQAKIAAAHAVPPKGGAVVTEPQAMMHHRGAQLTARMLKSCSEGLFSHFRR